MSVLVISFVAWFLALNLSNGPNARLAEEIRGSSVMRALDTVIPEPPDLLARVRDEFGRFDFPQVFAGLPPAPTGPVTGPSEAEAGAAFSAASGSTVRIVGQACGSLQEGSGFVVGEGLVATNAHVVAGADRVEVQQQDGASQPGEVVVFDPAVDVAVLRVTESPGEPLALATEEVPRGTGGAIVGHPSGGDLAGVDAAVTRVIDAKGRDIYGRRRVQRRVYELQAVVVPGNSGSPFVLADGTVAGMVFASSTSDPDLGYAVTSGQMRRDVERASTASQTADTGACS
jgi:S1-C subfamily serine protease